jgi:hypothetical protein
VSELVSSALGAGAGAARGTVRSVSGASRASARSRVQVARGWAVAGVGRAGVAPGLANRLAALSDRATWAESHGSACSVVVGAARLARPTIGERARSTRAVRGTITIRGAVKVEHVGAVAALDTIGWRRSCAVAGDTVLARLRAR